MRVCIVNINGVLSLCEGFILVANGARWGRGWAWEVGGGVLECSVAAANIIDFIRPRNV